MKLNIPFYQQSTSFTCDPACLMMVLKYFYPKTKLSQGLEFDIWRESYGIGIAGCMPQGLACSALSRNLNATLVCRREGLVQISNKLARREAKKVALLTSKGLLEKAKREGMEIIKKDPSLDDIEEALKNGGVPIVMVHKKDSPHWIVVSAVNGNDVYIHDPYSKQGKYMKVSRKDLSKMMFDLKKYSKIEKRMLILHK